jgi:tetratricopeptide (TPR) repeat protein
MTEARARHAAADVAGGVKLARRALDLDPLCVEAMEHIGTVLVTRRRQYAEGLELLERALTTRPDDAGLWYTLGWAAEFAAHELPRRGGDAGGRSVRELYERAAEAFRRCLELHPEGKLAGDAEDLLDHVENELRST